MNQLHNIAPHYNEIERLQHAISVFYSLFKGKILVNNNGDTLAEDYLVIRGY